MKKAKLPRARLEHDTAYRLTQYASRFDHRKESLANAIIDLGTDATIEKLMERTGYDRTTVEASLANRHFKKFFTRQCIKRGYTVDVAEERHRLDYHAIDMARSFKLSDPAVMSRLSLRELCAVERSIAQTDLMKRQTEHLRGMSAPDERGRLQNHREILERIQSTEAGKRFLHKKALEAGADPSSDGSTTASA